MTGSLGATLTIRVLLAALLGCGGPAAPIPRPAPPPSAAAQPYDDRALATELAGLVRDHAGTVAVERIGTTAEQRAVVVVRVGTRGPALLVIAGLHPDEHDMPMLAMRIVRRAASDPVFAARRLYVVPLANPDGTAFELVSEQPLSWRKNRRAGGANLNRNWDAHWQPGADAASSPNFPGDAPFSEPETRALRDFMRAHAEIAAFVDLHSGTSGFNQGFILYPYSYADQDALSPEWQARYGELATAFARNMTCAGDPRPALEARQPWQIRDRVREYLLANVPPEHQDAALAAVPASTAAAGASIDWVHDTLHVPALGVELSRPFAATSPGELAELTAHQLDRCFDAYYRAIVAFAPSR